MRSLVPDHDLDFAAPRRISPPDIEEEVNTLDLDCCILEIANPILAFQTVAMVLVAVCVPVPRSRYGGGPGPGFPGWRKTGRRAPNGVVQLPFRSRLILPFSLVLFSVNADNPGGWERAIRV